MLVRCMNDRCSIAIGRDVLVLSSLKFGPTSTSCANINGLCVRDSLELLGFKSFNTRCKFTEKHDVRRLLRRLWESHWRPSNRPSPVVAQLCSYTRLSYTPVVDTDMRLPWVHVPRPVAHTVKPKLLCDFCG